MMRGGSWWRRNWWALAGLAPILVGVVWLSPSDPYERWRAAEPREAVVPGADGWASYGGTRVRLVELAPADLREAFTSEPFPLPDGLRAWRATVTFGRIPNPDENLMLCELQLEDRAGRRFGDGPEEASGAALGPDGSSYLRTGCRPEEEQAGAPTFDVVALFVLPSSARPAALRLSAADELPAYVRFEVDPTLGSSPGPGT